jgi:hypothetical protein
MTLQINVVQTNKLFEFTYRKETPFLFPDYIIDRFN